MQTISEVKTTLDARRRKLGEFGLTLQPIPLIVGESLDRINSSYVAVDDTLYEVTTAIKAVDACFKIIHALHSLYPLESEQVWLLLQKCLYGFTTEWDTNFVCVNTLLSEFAS